MSMEKNVWTLLLRLNRPSDCQVFDFVIANQERIRGSIGLSRRPGILKRTTRRRGGLRGLRGEVVYIHEEPGYV